MEYLFLVIGVVVGTVLGVLVVALASVGSYDRGVRDARARRPSL